LKAKHSEAIPGLISAKNAQGHKVLYLHYTANPEKAKQEWIDQEAAKYIGGKNSLLWRREMEIDFKAGSGELVFPEFPELEAEIVCDSFVIPDTWRLYGGLDWGVRNPVSFHVYAQSPTNDFYSIWEYYRRGDETNVFEVSRIIKDNPYYKRMEWIAYDPSMNKEDQQRKDGLTSIIRMFQEEVPEKDQVQILTTAHDRNDMLAVSIFRNLLNAKKFKFFRECSSQIDEFRNLKYPERKEYVNEQEKLLDKNNHSWDDAKYFILSHPEAKVEGPKLKFGTIGYLNMISEMAHQRCANTGENYQQAFSDMYGKEI
jgi:hypothetical protein